MSFFRQRSGIILSSEIFIPIVLVANTLPIFASDNNTILIPPTNYPVILDGIVVVEKEWTDAQSISFPGARLDGQNVTVYLKYEQNARVLYGAFEIPGRSSVPPQWDSKEGIHFLFGTADASNEHLNSSDHVIALYRDKRLQYSIGDNAGKWTINQTSAPDETEIPLQAPFSKINFRIISSDDGWEGEFRIHFQSDPNLFSLSVLAETDVITRTGHRVHQSMIFPQTSSVVNPTTWTRILFEENTTSAQSPTACSPQLSLSKPTILGLNVTIIGEARCSGSEGHISNLHIDWGNGEVQNFKNFPISHIYSDSGSYDITVTVTDNNGLNATEIVPISVISINSTVQPPNEGPKISMSPASPIDVHAVSSAGTQVSYTATASDREDGNITPECNPPSGSIFPIGSTNVTCRAKDSAGSEDTESLMINVMKLPETELPWYQKAEYIVPIVTVIISSIIGPILVARYGQKKRSRDRNYRKGR